MDSVQVGTIDNGAIVQQVGQIGLAMHSTPLFVKKALGDMLILSEGPDAPPLTDVRGEPRYFPASAFRVLSS